MERPKAVFCAPRKCRRVATRQKRWKSSTRAAKGHKQVRLAAISALGRIGNATCVAPLLESAADGDAELAKAATEALVELPGPAVDKDLVSRLPKAEGKTYPVLIEVVGKRRLDATQELLKALNNSDRAVKSAALTALGNTVPDK